MRLFFAWSAYVLWSILILLCMQKEDIQKNQNKQSSVANPYEALQFRASEFIPKMQSEHEETQFRQQLKDFYRLAVNARIYVIQYQPRAISASLMSQCFERSPNVAEQLPLTQDEQKQCTRLAVDIEDRPIDQLTIKKQTSRPVILIFQSDVPVNYSFEGKTSKVQMMFLSGHSYTGVVDSSFILSGQAYSNAMPGLPFYSNSYHSKMCDMCTKTSIGYFRNHKSEAELTQAVLAYFNQPLYKVITVHEPSRIVLK